jgi:hypothetical protein
MSKTIQEIAQEARERIKDEAFHKTETGHSLDLTQTRQIIIDAITSYTEELKKKIEGKRKESEKFVPFQKIHYQSALDDIISELNHQ